MLRGPRTAAAGRSVSIALLTVGVMLLLACGSAMAQTPTSEEGERVRGYVPPPAELHLVGDHWTPYDPPEIPAGVDVHVVVKGDTLWDLAQQFYGDPYLWPVIWDANRYVTYSHWIYPGDPLEIPPQPTVVGEEGVEPPPPEPEPEPPPRPEPEPEPEPEPPPPEPEPEPEQPAMVPVLETGEQTCTIELVEYFDPTPLSISGREEPDKELQATGDIVYLSAGRDMGIQPGSEYVVVQQRGSVEPVGDMGNGEVQLIDRVARLRVIAVQATTSTAEIVFSCKGVQKGDYLVPFRPTPVPMVERVPLNQLADRGPGRLNGNVLVTGGGGNEVADFKELVQVIAGEGDFVGIDLGTRAGLTAGDRILFWRPGEGRSPRRVLAHGVVTIANAGGSTVKILESRLEVVRGDKAQVL
jgi:hypothetical protein